MSSNALVLDANILIRAVLGNKVRRFLLDFHELVDFFVPDVCFEDAEKYLPTIFEKRSASPQMGLEVLSKLQSILQIVDESIYLEHAIKAQQRMKNRDIHDWPVMATAFTFNASIWTEDQDFFGTGVPVWTTDRIQLFFDEV